MTRLWGRGVGWILGMKVVVHGHSNFEDRGVFVVSNHLSYLDIIAHSMIFPMRFTPKSDIIYWPIIGWLTAVSRPIWMKRKSRLTASNVSEKFIETLKNGVSLIVYPEGTSSSGRDGVLAFKSSVFEVPVKLDFSVLPVIISYPKMEIEDVCWFGEMTLIPHIWKVLALKKINVRLDFLPPLAPEGRDRKTFAHDIHEMINAKFNAMKMATIEHDE